MATNVRRDLAIGGAALAAAMVPLAVNSSEQVLAASAPLVITLAPKQSGGAAIVLGGTSPQVTVVALNAGKTPLRLWQDTCSWGYQNLAFEMTDSSGRRFKVTRAERGWDKNVPAWHVLPAGRALSTNVTLNADEWRGLPALRSGESRPMRIRAVYRNGSSYEARANHIWVGVASSAETQVTLSG